MDYDDNEFQSQNLQLAGEGSAKFPPVFRPYALPKFDFDDNVQGHLRFDGLVETEVFLGIESNEDNQWIEDYSRGGSGIEFRTSAAESCSISRHNNVWSEATSSESVEMLLKSVGQDQNIPEKVIIRESDACDELGCLVRQMESGSKRESSLSKTGDSIGVNHTSTAGELLGNDSVSKEDLGEQQPPIALTSQENESISSVHAGSSDPISDAVTGSMPLTEGRSIVDQRPVDAFVEPPNSRTEENSSAVEMQVDSTVMSVQNISSSELNKQDAPYHKSIVSDSEGVLKTEASEKGEGSHHAQEDEMNNQISEKNIVDSGTPLWTNPISLTPGLEAVEEANAVEASTADIRQPSSSIQEDFGLHRMQGQTENVQGGESENQVLLDDDKVGDSSKVDRHDSSPAGLEIHSSVDPEAPLLHQEDDKMPKVEADGSINDRAGQDAALNMGCSMAEVPVDTNVSLTSEVVKDASDNCKTDSNIEANTSPSTMAERTGAHEESLAARQTDDLGGAHEESLAARQTDDLGVDQETSVDIKQSTVLLSDRSNMENEVGKCCISDKASRSNKLLVPNSQSDPTGGNESAVHNVKLVSHDTTVGVDLPFKNAIASNSAISRDKVQVMGACEQQTQTSPHGVLPNKINQESTKESEECPLVFCSGRERNDGDEEPVISEVHKELAIKGNCEKTSSKASGMQSILKRDDMLTQPLPKGEMPSNKSQTSGRDNEAVLGSEENNCEQVTALSVGGGASVVQVGSIGSTTFSTSDAKSCAFESGSSCSNYDKPTCGSPTVIRASESSQSKSKKKGFRDPNNLIFKNADGNAHGVSSAFPDPKANNSIEGEQTFTFLVNADLSRNEAGQKLQPFSDKETMEVSPSGFNQLNPRPPQDISVASQKVSNREIVRSGSKGASERKRRASSKSAGKETAKKGNSVKDTASVRQSDKVDKTNIMSLNSSGIFQLPASNDLQPHGHPFGVLSTSTSTLPDLNTSSSAVFQQPFTDLQQVQLRAQIFVYGALIQGTAPDEAYMISAFGGPDGGRSIWESAWRMCVERLRGQKSVLEDAETPLQSRSGTVAWATDQVMKHGSVQAKVASSPLGRASSKSTLPPVVNAMMPLSSPLWSISTPSTNALQSNGIARGAVMDYQQAISPLHTQQTTPVRSFAGPNTSWISQTPFRGSWVASPPTPAFDISARFPPLPITEPVHLTPVKEPSVVHSSGAKHVIGGPTSQNLSAATVSPPTSSTLDSKKVAVSSSQLPTDPKSRKRKKVPVSESFGKVMLLSQSQPELVSTPVASHMSTSTAISTPASLVSKTSMERVIIPVSPGTCIDPLKNSDKEKRQRVALKEETLDKLKEARTQAEEAAEAATAAVDQSQEIWSQLDKQRNSGLGPDVESKLASAAMAIAAATAVAKAAAAAARVASNAALQAKLMADEVLDSSGPSNSSGDNETSLIDSVKTMGTATPASILKGENAKRVSSSIIFAAKEAARRKVEAATAASKRAENMDAIVKAAELAAEAVSQAGKIVAMGDPLPLSELIEASMDSYWREPRASIQPPAKTNGINSDKTIAHAREGPDTSAKQSEEGPTDREMHNTGQDKLPNTRQTSRDSFEEHARVVDDISSSAATSGKKDSTASELAKTIEAVPESEMGSRSVSMSIQISLEKDAGPLDGNSIKEGSSVEVFKNGSHPKAAWFSAKVLSLKDGKAYVSYDDIPSDGGHDKVKEWVALKGEEDAPKIRIARPFTVMPFEGTRKRRRAAMGEYTWSVGDRVDAWMDDSWWEGVVTEKSKKDESLYTVHFKAQGEVLPVRAWHLRPSLLWKDGEWVEWSNSLVVNRASDEVDAPQEKRLRLRSPVVEAKEKDKMSKVTEVVESGKSTEPRLLDLGENVGRFNIGKSSKDDSRLVGPRVIRTGLQKEGSRVVFGVPKPGKKRKFMDVSKHYDQDRDSKINEANDSSKLSKYLIPQGQTSGSRGWKPDSRNDPKERRAAVTKSKLPKSGKPPNISGRTIPQKNNLGTENVSVPDDGGRDNMSKSEDSANHAEDTSGKDNLREFRSFSRSDGAAEGPVVFSSMPGVPSKKAPNPKAERLTKGRLAPVGGKSNKVEDIKVFHGNSSKSTSEVVEPRRSNRKIQPTSRLLEGLQSSLIISKIPSASHDKSHKIQNRGASRGNSNG